MSEAHKVDPRLLEQLEEIKRINRKHKQILLLIDVTKSHGNLVVALKKAIQLAEEGWSYASEYFQTEAKYEARVKRLKTVLRKEHGCEALLKIFNAYKDPE